MAWQLGTHTDLLNISSSKEKYLSFGKAGYMATFRLSFNKTGRVHIYSITNKSCDPISFFSLSNYVDLEKGAPLEEDQIEPPVGDTDDEIDSDFGFYVDVIAGEIYNLYVRPYDLDETGAFTVYIETVSDLKEWDWYENDDREQAYIALTTHGPVSDFLYTVWNELIDKVVEAKNFRGYNWNKEILTERQTRMSSRNKTLTADRFNSLAVNAGYYIPNSLKNFSSGDQVKGEYFTDLTKYLNYFIEDIKS